MAAISSTGSYLRDLGGADLLTTSWRDGTRQFAASLSLRAALLRYMCGIDPERRLGSIQRIEHFEVSLIERRKRASFYASR